MNIILCGLPASGKSRIGTIIAKKLCWEFIDTDLLIEKTYHNHTSEPLNCRQIYKKEGSEVFRALEKEVITSLKSKNQCVIALGGGSLLLEENRVHLRDMGILIYLKASLRFIWKNLKARGLPSFLEKELPEEHFKKIAIERIFFYEACSKFHILVEAIAEETAALEILNKLDKKIDG